MKKAPFPEPKQEGMKPIEATHNREAAAHDSGLRNKEEIKMKKFSVSVTPEPLKEIVFVERPRAIIYDECKGTLKLAGNHPRIERIREIVNE